MTDVETAPRVIPLPRYRVAELRVKVRSLAAEAAIIRHEEQRALRKRRGLEPGAHRQWHGYTYERLREHRVKELRVEARAAQLAVAFLRGRPYLSVEQKVREPIDPGSKFAQKLHDLIWRFAVTGTRAEYDFGATGNAPSSTFLMQAVKSWLARPITAK